jgi:hypothetical protein
MRTKLTKMLTLRQSPFLKFHIDENLKKELAVLELLREGRGGERGDRPQTAEAAGAGTIGPRPSESGQGQSHPSKTPATPIVDTLTLDLDPSRPA